MNITGKLKILLLKLLGLKDKDMLAASNVKRGFDVFSKTGTTPLESYLSLIQLFCSTKGRSNDIIHFLISKKNPKIKLPSFEGTLGIKSKSELRNIVSDI